MAFNEGIVASETIKAVLKQVAVPKRELLGWKIWYTDGTVFTSESTKWEDLPVFGVQVVKKFWKYENGTTGAEMFCGADAYIDDHNKFTKETAYTLIKLGEYLLYEDYEKIRIQAHNDTWRVT
jgi:hypothetical protein